MWNPHGELRRTLARLKALSHAARSALATETDLSDAECADLCAQIAEADRLLIQGASARGASTLIAEAVTLLERCDPLGSLRAIKIDYIDRLAATCDSLMTTGEMPDASYLRALASAVCEFEAHHFAGAADETAFAWDILAQAEAGLGEATDETHYSRAQQRYRRRMPGEAPALVLVAGTAV